MKTNSSVTSGELVTLNKLIFSSISDWLSPKKGRGLIPIWLVVSVVLALISYAGYSVSHKIEGIDFEHNVIVPYFISGLYVVILVLFVERIISRLLSVLENSIVPSINSSADLDSLRKRLSIMFEPKKQAYFALGFSLSIHLLFIAPNLNLINVYGWGVISANIVLNFFHGICAYFVYSYAHWAIQELRNYDFSLYPLDPSSSEIIRVLAGIFNSVLYSIIIMITIITIVFIYFDIFTRVSIVITIAFMWVTASVIFAFHQMILAGIIQKGKWKTLNEIQAEIIGLQTKDPVPSPATLDHIEKLVALHESVKSTPDSALSLGSFVKFLNSLVVPTISVLITTIENVEKLLNKILP